MEVSERIIFSINKLAVSERTIFLGKYVMTKDTELKEAVKKFVDAFEQVFDKDWSYTKENLGIWDRPVELDNEDSIPFISDNGTFLNPKVDDETENWGYRASLLNEYRRLKKLLADT